MSEQRRPTPSPFELDPAAARILPETEPEPTLVPPVEPPPPDHSGSRRRLGILLVTGLLGLLVLQSVLYVRDLVSQSPLFGWPFAALLALVGASSLALIGRELRDMGRLARRAELRDRAARLAGSELHGEAPVLLEAIGQELAGPKEAGRAVETFRGRASDALADGERLVLFERTVLAPLDRRAYRLVLESARDIGLLTALSPLGLLDSLVVLWRTLHLLKAIARLYGMAPGPAASLALFRKCLRNAALAGMADLVTQATLEHAGASLLASLSARAGQGAGNALLVAKLGLEAIRETRPLPFLAEEPPRLAHIRKALFDPRSAG